MHRILEKNAEFAEMVRLEHKLQAALATARTIMHEEANERAAANERWVQERDAALLDGRPVPAPPKPGPVRVDAAVLGRFQAQIVDAQRRRIAWGSSERGTKVARDLKAREQVLLGTVREKMAELRPIVDEIRALVDAGRAVRAGGSGSVNAASVVGCAVKNGSFFEKPAPRTQALLTNLPSSTPEDEDVAKYEQKPPTPTQDESEQIVDARLRGRR